MYCYFVKMQIKSFITLAMAAAASAQQLTQILAQTQELSTLNSESTSMSSTLANLR